ncbi:myoferlin-like [Xenopus laevis]|uniref:Myoferlin-like n=1 Tax=Xenopus laevis TaxID=8355 RepID=A0A8J1LEC7_XENLA|nr:myoferlin-like [Xenopus laevis]
MEVSKTRKFSSTITKPFRMMGKLFRKKSKKPKDLEEQYAPVIEKTHEVAEIVAEEGRAVVSEIASTPKQQKQQQANQPFNIPSQIEKNENAQEFKIQVRIIEGRQLTGNNIKPVVKVKIGHQTQHTRILSGNNPPFNQMLTYDMHRSLSDLRMEPITIQALRSRAFRADSLIGEFMIDAGFIYDEPGHAVIRKWVALSIPKDTALSTRGYLKLSIFILGRGDQAPTETAGHHEDDDVENNLLLTSGVVRQTVTSVVKIYRANDIPQMDDTFMRSIKGLFRSTVDKKNLADPFIEAAFAGEKVQTKIIKESCCPIWNQAITLPMKIPSMCDNVRLRVYDWDRANKNDIVGTANLALSKIFSPATGFEGTGLNKGFLPTFGPSYINLYGSPREFKRYPDHYDELNYGKGEGIAYRGRILVEITSSLDESTKGIEDISKQDVLAVEKYQFKQKYSLCAVFHSATMLQDASEAVQFEVSIGNYGNKFDSTCKALPSTTQYRQPLFDGNFYYYIPWYASKPVVALTSYWEDISHRLDAVNIFTALTDRLQCGLSSLKLALQANVTKTEAVSIWQSLLDQLIEDARKPLPPMVGKNNVNELDVHLQKLRLSALTHIREAATRIRREVTDVKSTLPMIEEWIDRLQQLSEEPQNSMPDIIIWMIKAEKRVAYARIPAHQILFSKTGGEACGKFCGKIQTIFLKFPLDKSEGRHVPVQLRVILWLGLSEAESEFNKSAQGTFSVHAEMYENQSRLSGKWSSRFLLNHHKFSDATGTVKLKKKKFVVPEGWKWESDWQVNNERSLPHEDYNEHLEITDEVFEHERRLSNEKWQKPKEAYTNATGEKLSSPDKIDCPHGWIWDDDIWKCDVNRAVDENGWEYGKASSPDNLPQHWVSSEKTYHTNRRRRLVRRRSKVSTPKEEVMPPKKDKGWEYAAVSGWRFHTKKCSTDTFRRRCWIRNMVSCAQTSSIFNLEGYLVNGDKQREDQIEKPRDFYREHVPFVSCTFGRASTYHLRCYLYQARGLTPMDRDSFSDPYAHVSFLYQSKRTEIINCTLNPTWDQTLVFSDIDIFGEPCEIEQNPPSIVIELYDSDQRGEDDFLGRSLFFPVVKLDPNISDTPKLFWCPVTMGKRHCGDILVAAELFLPENNGCNLPVLPSERAPNIYMVPDGIRPVLKLTSIEILTWGLRNISHLESARSATLIVECGGEMVQAAITGILGRNPNFQSAVIVMRVYLPQEEIYTPPIVIKVIANKHFGRKEVVGQCTIEQLEEFHCDPYTMNQDLKAAPITTCPNVVIDMEGAEESLLAKEEEDDVDWWTKYFASKGEHDKSDLCTQRKYDTLKVYDCELERVPEFLGLTDFCQTFKLYTGKATYDDEPTVAGEFKGSFCMYQIPEDPDAPLPPQHFRELPDSRPQECIVRVYIVRGIDLQPKDNNGLCDPYIKLKLNKKVVTDRENYVPNTLNPMFGKMYELSCIIPQEKDLKIFVYDYDALSGDDKVGETTIDLENRLLSGFRSHCGLPETYCISGVNRWRDQLKPSEILQHFAKCRALPLPVYEDDGRTLIFSGSRYTSASIEKAHEFLGPASECLALKALHNQELVPEHVETRTLYSTCQPDIPQGRVEMWVDIFPKSLGPPGPAVNIVPRKPKQYVLRVIVWNTKDVILDDINLFGEKMSDIYVKGWLLGHEDDKQRTDVHYRSLDGEGNFNWRFVFPFNYFPAEQQCTISKKEHVWSLDATEIKLPPKLFVQIWDNDKFSRDDYLGCIELDLNNVIMPATEPKECSLKLMDKPQMVSLFKKKSIKGWWPCYLETDEQYNLTGKVELTLEVLTEQEAEKRPAGKGRDPPNTNPTLSEPMRPETSFLWFQNIFKMLKFAGWRNISKLCKQRECVIAAVIVLFVIFTLFFLSYIMPLILS